MALKDTKLEEKEEVVIHGTILADEFRDRQTGKKIDPLGNKVSADEIDSGSTTSGKVLKANGTGGAEWGNIPTELPSTASASEGQVLGLDSDKNPQWQNPISVSNYLTSLTGYDATKTQTLKNVSGVLTWVDDE